MLRDEYQISFNTPGFVGDAEQQSAWRTPPLKALLQHWWRVAVAKQYGYGWQKVREAEGRLFGHAWLDNGSWAMRSRVRIKLSSSAPGSLEKERWVFEQKKLEHKEVKMPIGADLYLGFGPLLYSKDSKKTELKQRAINAREQNQLTLSYPEEANEEFADALQLIHWFGTIGGRSRNAWGSVELKMKVGATPSSRQKPLHDYEVLLNGNANLTRFQRSLKDCLTEEWPHAIGSDQQGLLIWKTPKRDNWQLVMKDLAQTKIKFRTDLIFPAAKPGGFEKRHLLAYPVTNHRVNDWGNNGRLANQLRFKVASTENGFVGIIVHLPCAMPKEMSQGLRNAPSIEQQVEIWQSVHQSLISLKEQGAEIQRITQ